MLGKFPFYKQHDQMDCGPTCIRMIAKHYGRNVSLNYLRSKSLLTREGVSLLGLSEAAEAIGFRTLAVKLPLQKMLDEAPLPCVVHWNQDHFVVVHKVKKNIVHVADPGTGLVTYTVSEFKRSWVSAVENGAGVGVVLLLEPTPSFFDGDEVRSETTKLNLFQYVKQYRSMMVQLLVGLVLGSLMQITLPFLTQSVIDTGINTRNVNFIYLMLSGQLMLFFGRTVVDLIRRWILLHLSTRINIALISDFLVKLMKLPLSFFDSKMIGDLLQRIDDHARVERLISSSSLNMFFSFFNLLIFGGVLAFYNVTIFITFLSFSALYVCYVVYFLGKRKAIDHKKFQQMSENQSALIQIIHGMSEIKLNNCETQRRWEWENIQAKIFRLNVRSMQLLQYQDAGGFFINELKNIMITFMTAMAVINGEMTLGMMLAVQFIIGQLNSPVTEFIAFMREYQDANLSMDRISEIHAMENEEKEADEWADESVLPASRTIMINDITFHYSPNAPPVLKEFELIIPEGKITAIVGASGSGKTTLMKLLLKFYNASKGNITVGGLDLRNIPSSLWRKHCGVVLQDGYIFSDTIARNIALSDEHIDRNKLQHAVAVANIQEFIHSLPSGFNTKVGMDGIGLSHGQKQRLLIARAVYKDPEYIILDEATSALDANNERIIKENLDHFFKGRTVILIAHRLSTVKNADQIVVIERGKIIETGTHDELTITRGAYYQLVKNQLELGK
jgi:ATP-binding cassette subfamily B protein